MYEEDLALNNLQELNLPQNPIKLIQTEFQSVLIIHDVQFTM